ncbi:MAG: IS1/IS6 family transposase [Candidatus Aenigmarchaeota archaeon]|nr:IS1/IS6 family transposase [Candidatus Aenigmarchaeota archaeon]
MEIKCRFCRNTDHLSHGYRKNKSGKKRVYKCLSCGKTFSHNDGFLKMRFDKKFIGKCIYLFINGMSVRKIVNYMKDNEGIEVSHATILRWKSKYGGMLKEYENSMVMNYDEECTINSDETMIKVNGNFHYLWGSINKETKYLLSLILSDGRGMKDAIRMFSECKSKMKNDPKYVVTDGFGVYPRAFKKAYFKYSPPRAYHVVSAGIKDRGENNPIERFFGHVKDRTRTTRGGFDNMNSATDFMNLFSVFYNQIRPHMSLNGRTPAQAAGIDLNLKDNKLLDLIERSADWHGDHINKENEASQKYQ